MVPTSFFLYLGHLHLATVKKINSSAAKPSTVILNETINRLEWYLSILKKYKYHFFQLHLILKAIQSAYTVSDPVAKHNGKKKYFQLLENWFPLPMDLQSEFLEGDFIIKIKPHFAFLKSLLENPSPWPVFLSLLWKGLSWYSLVSHLCKIWSLESLLKFLFLSETLCFVGKVML